MSSSGRRPKGRWISSRSSKDFCLQRDSPVWISAFLSVRCDMSRSHNGICLASLL
ncbi:hypothetical protein OIU77_021668 [Salix suchowensis]|uniref:Uncharacterized protein n=1 Tax=Salix suchowensis TaxID=1278906 RepID=A0ABQ9CDZ4_9ROSI|nr:hypothetical protein OIU77_021668 [Salix suchowensis]